MQSASLCRPLKILNSRGEQPESTVIGVEEPLKPHKRRMVSLLSSITIQDKVAESVKEESREGTDESSGSCSHDGDQGWPDHC
jgi:hypothetical protein